MQKSTISIIIPSRNRFTYIQELINDLKKQDLPPDEVIVVDQSLEPYKGLACIHIVDQGVGPCRAKNIGIREAHGDVIVFLDDDIRIEANFLRELCEPIIKQEYCAVTGAICDKDGHYPFESQNFWRKKTSSWITALTANPDFPGKKPTLSFPTGCSAVSKSVADKIGLFDEFFDPDGAGEDREYALRIFHNGCTILFNGMAKAKHLAAPSGGRRSDKRKGLNPLEKNSVYIVAKYFNDSVLNSYCDEWLLSILRRALSLNPISWLETLNYLKMSRSWISRIKMQKQQNNWY